MHELVTFESASKYITEIITDFKDLIVSKYKELQDAEWTFDKGSTKVCTADEKGKKMILQWKFGNCLCHILMIAMYLS